MAVTGTAVAPPGGLPRWRAMPRRPMSTLPTPLLHAPELARGLALPGQLWVKRDDLIGLAVAGNKARPLELLIADALAVGADTLVTGGAATSNFIAAAAAACATAGLRCELVLPDPARGEPDRPHPNLLAARAFGATSRRCGSSDRAGLDTAIPARAAQLEAAGRRCYWVPRGGSTPLGAVGFALAAAEVAAQLDAVRRGRAPLTVVVAVGSGGTLAGLVAGIAALGLDWQVLAVCVSRPVPQVSARVTALVEACLALGGYRPRTGGPVVARTVWVDGRGPGHGLASDGGRAAARDALRLAGLVLDPVYTAKALAALREVSGRIPGDVVFWHTGGLLDAVDEWCRDAQLTGDAVGHR